MKGYRTSSNIWFEGVFLAELIDPWLVPPLSVRFCRCKTITQTSSAVLQLETHSWFKSPNPETPTVGVDNYIVFFEVSTVLFAFIFVDYQSTCHDISFWSNRSLNIKDMYDFKGIKMCAIACLIYMYAFHILNNLFVVNWGTWNQRRFPWISKKNKKKNKMCLWNTMPPIMDNSKEGQDYKDKYFDTSRKILSQEMTMCNMEALVSLVIFKKLWPMSILCFLIGRMSRLKKVPTKRSHHKGYSCEISKL